MARARDGAWLALLLSSLGALLLGAALAQVRGACLLCSSEGLLACAET